MEEKTRQFLSLAIRESFSAGAAEIKKRLVHGLRDVVHFDAALWASGHVREYRVHNTFLCNLPAELMESWEKIKGQDRLLARLIRQPGRTVDVSDVYSPAERANLPVDAHSRRFGIRAAISIAVPDADSGLLEVMSLYRGQADRPFSGDDKGCVQFVFPLLIQLWHYTQIRHMEGRDRTQGDGVAAICDGRGWIRHAEAGFPELLRGQWPRWQPPVLPKPVRDWMADGTSAPFHGPCLVIKRNFVDDLILLRANPVDKARALSPRETQIAEFYAAGLTYREISAHLGLAPSTVRRHIENVYQKLGVASKIELLREIQK